MKNQLLLGCFMTLILSSLTLGAQEQTELVYPYTIEGATVEIIKPASRDSDGLVKVKADGDCSFCSKEYVITIETKILLANSGIQTSSVDLIDYVHKPATVHISGPKKIGGFSFAE